MMGGGINFGLVMRKSQLGQVPTDPYSALAEKLGVPKKGISLTSAIAAGVGLGVGASFAKDFTPLRKILFYAQLFVAVETAGRFFVGF